MKSNHKKIIILGSSAIYITILIVAYIFRFSGPLSIFILSAKIIVYVISILLLIKLIFSIKRKNIKIWQIGVFFLSVLLIAISAVLYPAFSTPGNRSIKLVCKENLRQYYISLKQYADDNNGYFPLEDNMMGLNILHEYGYIAFPLNCWGQYDFTIYKFAQKQPENTYYYYGGHNIQESPPVVIMEDKDGNHKDGYKLYLYNDGNIVTAKMP